MKKTYAKIITILLVIITALSLVGCSFTSSENSGSSGSSGVTGLVAPINLPDSLSQSEGIVFEEDTTLRQGEPMTLTEATAKVKGSAVMITSQTETESGAGSGVIVDISDGKSNEDTIFYILTCAHLCKENANVKVYLPDSNFRYNENEDYIFSGVIGGKKESVQNNAVTLVGSDKESDVAVLRLNIADSNLTAADITKATVMSTKYSPSYGEQVFAIGNPSGGMPGTLSTGVVSYLNRQVSVENVGVMTLTQIDLTTHPGSSGGGLYNMYGELIGITNSGDTEFPGLNFAIPHKIDVKEGELDNGFINIAKQLIGTAVANEFENYGYVSGRKVKLGITISQDSDSVKIISVTENSLAYYNGFIENDVITLVKLYKNGETTMAESKNITQIADFSEITAKAVVGDKLLITVQRKVQSGIKYYLQSIEKEFQISQYYFCDTGVYPEG